MTAKRVLRYLRNVWQIRFQCADEDLIDVAWRELQIEYAGEELLTWTERNVTGFVMMNRRGCWRLDHPSGKFALAREVPLPHGWVKPR